MTNEELAKKVDRRWNVLVCYDGGGYDGCIWERNVFLLGQRVTKKNALNEQIKQLLGDKTCFSLKTHRPNWGIFTDLGSSGRRAIKDIDRAIEVLTDEEDEDFYKVDVYDLTKQSDIERFQNEEPIPLVVSVVNRIASLDDAFKPVTKNQGYIWFKCDMCGEKCYGDPDNEGHMEGFHGCGGIAITADEKYCNECFYSHSCSYCGEFDKKTKQGLCEFHFEYALKELITQEDSTVLYYDSNANEFKVDGDPDGDDYLEYEEEDLYCVDIEAPQYLAIHSFYVMAEKESKAIEYVSLFLDGKYHSASCELATKYIEGVL
jgi:hypothetical protein